MTINELEQTGPRRLVYGRKFPITQIRWHDLPELALHASLLSGNPEDLIVFSYFFRYLKAYRFPLFGMADALVFQLDRVNGLVEVRVCPFDMDNIT